MVSSLGIELSKFSNVEESVSVLIESLEYSSEMVIRVGESSVSGDVHVLLELIKSNSSTVVSVVHSELRIELSSGKMNSDLGIESCELSFVDLT